MRLKGINAITVEASLNEGQDTVLLELSTDTAAQAVELDEHGLDLLIKHLQSLAQDVARTREFREAQRIMEGGGLG